MPELFRTRDASDKAILCYNCHKLVENNRPIVTCTVCGRYWHNDCVDPPLANPGRVKNWRCPLHVDELQAELLGPAHKWRRAKGARTIVPAYSRGLVNNGFIEVDDDLDTSYLFGKTYRISALGIIKDFMSR